MILKISVLPHLFLSLLYELADLLLFDLIYFEIHDRVLVVSELVK